jgi:hypothetical protein
MRDMDADDPFVKLVKRIVRRSVVKAFIQHTRQCVPAGRRVKRPRFSLCVCGMCVANGEQEETRKCGSRSGICYWSCFVVFLEVRL